MFSGAQWSIPWISSRVVAFVWCPSSYQSTYKMTLLFMQSIFLSQNNQESLRSEPFVMSLYMWCLSTQLIRLIRSQFHPVKCTMCAFTKIKKCQ